MMYIIHIVQRWYVKPIISVTYIWLAFIATATDRLWLKFISAILASAIPIVQLCYRLYLDVRLKKEKDT